jgi:serine/threonine protein kinase
MGDRPNQPSQPSRPHDTTPTIAHDPASPVDADEGKPLTLDRPSVVEALLDPSRQAPSPERYRIEREIAVGGMGRVVLAHDKDLARPVAVKMMRRSSPRARQRFVEEVQLAGMLQHPNIVPLHDVGLSADGTGWYTMRFVDGDTLADVIAKLAAGDPLMHARFTPARRMKLFFDVLDAVAYAHARGVVHRDLKPSNILVGQHGEAFVTDWGIAARVEDVTSGETTGVVGTPQYMAPEQARGDAADVRADVYALSAILFELLTLNHYLHPLPRTAPKERVLEALQREVPMLATGAAHPAQPMRVPMDVSRALVRGLAKDITRRYQTVHELRDALVAIEEGRVRVQCPSTAALWGLGSMRRVMSRAPVLGWFAVAAFFGLAGYGAFALARTLVAAAS